MLHSGSKLLFTHTRGFADAVSRKISSRAAGRAVVSLLALVAAAPQVHAQTATPDAVYFYDVADLNPDHGSFDIDLGIVPRVSGDIDTAGTQGAPVTLNYAAVYFRPSVSGTFVFGQNNADQDTLMLFYDGVFNSADPLSGLAAGSDDVEESVHQDLLRSQDILRSTVSCMNSTNRCPLVTRNITAGSIVSLVITSYDPAVLLSNLSFYTTAQGDFATTSTGFPPLTPGIWDRRNASTITENNFFNGGTVVMDSDLAVDLGVAGTGGTFEITANDIYTLSGALSDHDGETGLIRVVGTTTGPNELHFTGENTHTGGIAVERAILTLGGTRSIGDDSITLNNGAIAASAPLTVSQALNVTAGTVNAVLAGDDDITLAGGVSGDGALLLNGLGTVSIGGSSSFAGFLDVDGGTELLFGTRAARAQFNACDEIAVGEGSAIGGNGITCSVHISGGTLSPGFSAGTLMVDGDLTLDDGSNYQTEVDGSQYNPQGGAGTYDRVIVSGDLTVSGDLDVVFREIGGEANNNYASVIGDNFTILTAQSVSGAFTSVLQPAEGLGANQRIDIVYSPTSVRLAATPVIYQTLASSNGWRRNAVAVVRELDAVRPAVNSTAGQYHALFNNIYGLKAEALEKAAAQLSGEIHANAMQANAEASKQALRSIGDAIGQTGYAGAKLWMQYIGSWTPQRQDDNSFSFTSKNNGFAMGVNVVNREDLRIGFAGSHMHANLSNPIGGRATGNMVGAYGYLYAQPANGFDLAAVLGAAWSDLDTTRDTTGYMTTETAYARTTGHNLLGSVKARYQLFGGQAFSVWAASGLVIGENVANPFVETAASQTYALNFKHSAWTSVESNLGLDVEHKTDRSRVAVSFNWQHQLNNQTTPDRFVELEGLSWQVLSNNLDRDAFAAGFAITHELSDNVSLRAAYEGRLRNGQTLSRASAGVGMKF